MKILSGRLIYRILRHILFWLFFFGSLFIMTGLKALNLHFLLVDLPITLFYTYLVAYFLIPYFLNRKQYFLLFLSIAVVSVFLSYIRLLNYGFLYYSIYSAELTESGRKISFPVLLLNAKDFSFGMVIFLAFRYTFHWLYRENEEEQIRTGQIETEFKLIQTQVDPHFLFNTMNNFYSLSVSGEKGIRTQIRKMWGLMDYLSKQSNFKEIRLDKEIKMINDYVDLERLRYGDRLDFSLRLTGNLRDYRVPPMIYYPFVENCFKHGCASDPGFPWVYLSFTELKDRVRFTARNSITTFSIQDELKNTGQKGIDNIRKRLQYQLPGRHKLKIEKKNREFEVVLDILY